MDIETLKSFGTIKKFKADEFICYEGEVGSEMFIILSGQVGIYVNFFGSGPQKMAILNNGDFLGEMSMLENQPRNASGIAESDVIVLAIAKENFRRFLQTMPDLAYRMMQGLSRRIRHLEQILLQYGQEDRQTVLGNKLEEHLSPVEQGKIRPLVAKQEKEYLDKVGILPENHKLYNIDAPETHRNYYYEKQITCPICNGEFSTRIPRMTKLRLEKRDNDLREIFMDFDPLWYSIRTCSHCFFAQYYTDFDRTQGLSAKGLQPYQKKAELLKGKFILPPSEPLSIDRVFADYYLAIYFAAGDEENPLMMGKLYMSLSWLYQDVGDEEFYHRSWNRAFDYYHNAYYGANVTKLKPEHEQQLCIILGELYVRKGEVREALKHFYAAIRRADGVSYYNNLARDRYMEIKETVTSR